MLSFITVINAGYQIFMNLPFHNAYIHKENIKKKFPEVYPRNIVGRIA